MTSAALTTIISLLLATTGLTGSSPGSATGVWPLDPRPAVVAGFDPPLSAYGAGHRGVDLAGAPGQQVRAAAAGRVTFAGSLAGRGVVVVEPWHHTNDVPAGPGNRQGGRPRRRW